MSSDVVSGDARLVSPWEVPAGDRTVGACAIVIATGRAPSMPPTPGLDQWPHLTSANPLDREARMKPARPLRAKRREVGTCC